MLAKTCQTCGQDISEEVRLGDLTVYKTPPLAFWRGERLDLPPIGARMLHNIIARGGRPASVDSLSISASSSVDEPLSNQHLDVQAWRIRRALSEQFVPIKLRKANCAFWLEPIEPRCE